jgi:F-type H+-transporting ATPase subunit gamma
MANLKEIRGRIRTVITTQQMTRAMKMVAAAKLGRAQKNIERLRPYASKLQKLMGDIAANVSEGIDSPYVEPRMPEKVLLVVVTSNRGLCGAFNTNVCKEAEAAIATYYSAQEAAGNLEILAIGKKAFEYFKRRGYKIVGEQNHDVFMNLSFDTVNEVASMVMDGFVAGTWDRVDMVYNEFKNVATQVRRHERFLPVDSAGQLLDGKAHQLSADYIFEPSKEEILADLIPKSLRIQFYRTVLESNAGEQGARMMAMENATTNAEELLRVLRLGYNRARQAAITTEILEIVAGAEALASNG